MIRLHPGVLSALILIFLAASLPSAEKRASQESTAVLPDSPQGRNVKMLLEVVKQNDPNKTTEFIKTYFHPTFIEFAPMKMHLEAFGQMHQELGDFQIKEVRGDQNVEDVILLSGNGSELYRLHVAFDPDSLQFASIGLERFDDELENSPPLRTFDDVSAYLQSLTDSNRFSGVVLIAHEDRPVFFHAYGLAEKSKKVPNRLKTRFNVGSITKLFTAVAILQLSEQGKLRLEDPMGRFLPDFPTDIKDRVKIIHLLKMESGYGDYLMLPEYHERRKELKNVSDLMAILRKMPLQFEPGSNRLYSNAGYAILGGIIEKASGQDYYDYILENVFKPATMLSSGFPRHDEARNDIAVGYTNDGPEGIRDYTETNNSFFALRGSPAGGSYSSAEDILRFDMALRKNLLINPKHTALLLNFFDDTQTELPPDSGFAGGAPGISAVTLADYESKINIIVLSNYDEPLAETIGKVLRRNIKSILKLS